MLVIVGSSVMVNARKVILLRKSSQATGIFMRSISHTAATKVSQSPVLNAAEKESFNCCIFRSRYLKSLPFRGRLEGVSFSIFFHSLLQRIDALQQFFNQLFHNTYILLLYHLDYFLQCLAIYPTLRPTSLTKPRHADG